MKLRNVSPLGEVFTAYTGPVAPGEIVEVPDEVAESLGLDADPPSWQPVTDKSTKRTTESPEG